MTPEQAFLISESIKILLGHLATMGSLNNLTQAQAEAMVQKLAADLPSVLPSPEDLETLPPNPA
jgi:hypothetical protein